MEFQNYLSIANFNHPSWDLIIFLILLVTAFFYTILIGRTKLVLLLFTIYLSYLIINLVSLRDITEGLETNETFVLKLILFLGILIILFLMLNRSLASSSLRGRGESLGFLEAFILSLSEVGLLFSIILSFLPKNNSFVLSSLSRGLFLSENSLLIWTILSIMVIFWIGKK